MWLVDFDLPMGNSYLSSKSGRDFWNKFKAVAPFEIRGMQTNNGSEFLGEFAKELERRELEHSALIILFY
ncbi:MAG: hypothetical protein N3D14_03515 [Aquificaceae bacterium]|nr:hypothetical protein [Caldimicrobium sp.]MCX8164442.1 hypothetical protein [Aquificaceae bacterium]